MSEAMFINGARTCDVSALDRGLQFGDGLFETIAVFNGELPYWSMHWRRLCLGCKKLCLPVPDEAIIKTEINDVLKDTEKQVVKLIYTRGVGERGYRFQNVKPTRIVLQFSWPDFNEKNTAQGIELFPCKTLLSRQPLLAGVKHLNRLENVLARHEWQNPKYAEGLLSDIKGNVIEGTMSNLFMVKDENLKTPDLSYCGVAGITRQRIIDVLQKARMTIEICDIKEQTLYTADEIFMCNSLIGIWPVKKIARHRFATDKASNPITRMLQRKINPYHECIL